MKIYFAGSISCGRERVLDYKKIVDYLDEYNIVLDKHVADINLKSTGESIPPEEIYERDINWINECDLLIAEVSIPSLGVGYEISYALSKGKKVICLYEDNIKLSAMIKGNKSIKFINYKDIDSLLKELNKYL